MPVTTSERVNMVKAVHADHQNRWSQRMPELRRWKQAYQTEYYTEQTIDNGQIVICTADCFGYVEGYIASLFSKEPAVEVGADAASTGDPGLVREACNRFLFDRREAVLQAARMALIYQCSFLKMTPRPAGQTTNILDRMELTAIPPWETIVDTDAMSWESQRFCGHVYYMPLQDAKAKFGDKKWSPVEKQDYFSVNQPQSYRVDGAGSTLPDHYLYIQVMELYDLVDDKLIFWSPNWKAGAEVLECVDIPVRSFDDRPLIPMGPIYFSRVPDQPLEGMSAVHRIYDQFMEKNTIRSFWANAIRRDSRQYLYRGDIIDEETAAKITAGIDGLMIPVEGTESLAGLISEVPSTPIQSNHDRYLAMVESDLTKGSILAPFTRGVASGGTATETAALAQYSASEIGRMARERDSAIERVAEIYIRMLSLFVEEGDSSAVLKVDGKPVVVTEDKLAGKFRFVAVDQAAVPLAKEQEKRRFIELIPVLSQLQVPVDMIRKEIVRLFDLPRTFDELPQVATPAPPLATQPGGAGPEMMGPEQQLAATGGVTPEMIRAESGAV